MSPIKKYLIHYSLFIVLVAIALFYWNGSQGVQKTHPQSWIIYGLFVLVYLLNHLYLTLYENKNPAVFVRRFMGSTALRLFLFFSIMLGYAVTHKALANLFIWHILIFYFIFTVFEIVRLYNHFKKKI